MPKLPKSALVISGGGAKGAFAVGVIKYLYDQYSQDNWFSIVGGTSTGALIAPMAALISQPDPIRKEAMDTLVHLYSNVTTSDILEKQGITELLVRQDCLYESDPLHTLIHQHFPDDWFNRLKQAAAPDCYVVYTNYQTGQKVAASPKDANMTRESFIKCMMASASVPVIMEATKIGEEVCYDGGVRDLLPFSNAIDLGAEIIVPIFLEPERFNETKAKFKRVDKILLRTLAILVDEVGINDHKMAELVNTAIQAKKEILDTFKDNSSVSDKLKRIFNNPDYKNLFGPNRKVLKIIQGLRPSIVLTEDSLTFDPAKMRAWMKWGEEKAKMKIKSNPFILE